MAMNAKYDTSGSDNPQHLGTILSQIAHCDELASEIARRSNSLADGVLGSKPPADCEDSSIQSGYHCGGEIVIIMTALDSLSARLYNVMYELGRLEGM